MDDQQHAAARAAMEQDAADVATRDQTAWDLNVATTLANIDQTQAIAHDIRARGDLRDSLASAVTIGTLLVEVIVVARLIRAAWRAVR